MTISQIFGCTDEAALAAAFLHDVMENTDEGYDDLEKKFGVEVVDLVAALTKKMMLPKGKRDQEYADRLRQADWRARLIKLADEYDNYTDVLKGRKEGSGEEIEKCAEFVGLAKVDAATHAETTRAIAALERLLQCRKLK